MDSPPTLPSTEPTSAKVESGAPPSQMAPMPTPLPSDMESLPSALSSCPAISASYVHTSRRRTDRHRHIHTRLLSLPQSRALLLHIKSMLSHSREVDGRALPMKKHFLCKLESHAEQPTYRESGPGERVWQEQQEHNRTDATTSLPASGIWLPRGAPPTSPFRSHKHPLCHQLPPMFPDTTRL